MPTISVLPLHTTEDDFFQFSICPDIEGAAPITTFPVTAEMAADSLATAEGIDNLRAVVTLEMVTLAAMSGRDPVAAIELGVAIAEALETPEALTAWGMTLIHMQDEWQRRNG